MQVLSLEARARDFASLKHGAIDQRRKYTGDPYIVHPAAVAKIVREVPHTEAMLAAAWLHDTVEDTETTFAEIEDHFGREVKDLVEMLTDVSRPSDGNRAARKAIDRAHTAKASPQAKTVKLADLIDNARSILAHDQNFAVTYMREMDLLMPLLAEGDPTLHARASAIVKNNLLSLGQAI
jgi:(p)ppGpp synthase/HD superfamily hydrolase